MTGCKLGKRTLKYRDYGKLAASVVNVDSGSAVCGAARVDSWYAAWKYAPEGATKKESQLVAGTRKDETEGDGG